MTRAVNVLARRADLILELDGKYAGLYFPGAADSVAEEHSPEQTGRQDDVTDSETHINSSNYGCVQGQEDQDAQVDMHVSSRHLTEASFYFDVLLSQRFSEGNTDGLDCVQRIALKEVHVQAFMLLMDIVHLRTTKLVDRCVDVEMLFQVCVLIDMYSMHEATLMCTNMWFDKLTAEIPINSSPALGHWTFISYVLRRETTFRALTALVQRHHLNLEIFTDIPLPAFIGEKIQDARQRALSRCTQSLKTILEDYRTSSTTRCPRRREDCDALVLGSLIRRLRGMGLYPPSKKAVKFTVDELCRKLGDLEVTDLCATMNDLFKEHPLYLNIVHESYGDDDGPRARIVSIQEALRTGTQGIGFEAESDGSEA